MKFKSQSRIEQLEILRLFTEYTEFISRYSGNNQLVQGATGNLEGTMYYFALNNMDVSKLSKFSDSVWDFNNNEFNAPANVKGAKLRLNYSDYINIPKFIITELKCLMHSIYLNPKNFRSGYRSNSTIKANTLIQHFKSGLRFLDFVFGRLNQDGKEFIQARYTSLRDIIQSDIIDASLEFKNSYGNSLKRFFYYLKHINTTEILGYQIPVDFEALDWKITEKSNNSIKVIFDNESLWKQVSYASNSITQFLVDIGETPKDSSGVKFLNATEKKHSHLHISKELLDAYTTLRLYQKGYSQDFIESICEIPSFLKSETGKLYSESFIRKKIPNHYSEITDLNDIRKKVNDIYYCACYIVAQFTAMRPSALAEILLDGCLFNENGILLLFSDDKKGQTLNLGLFDDKWVTIPIIEDAIRAASIIAKMRGNKYLYASAVTLRPGELERKMTSTSIAELTANVVKSSTGKDVKKVKPYVMRDTLAFQLFRADLGLPYISFHLKHLVNQVDSYRAIGATTDVTLSYGDIGTHLTGKHMGRKLQHMAEVEVVENSMDPEGTYLGKKGKEHSNRVKKVFEGYMASGYTKDQVFDAMAKQGIAIINMGTGFCYGGVEDFDESLPCIGGLRCNTIRCKNAIVTKSNAPKWREVYVANKALIGKAGYENRQQQILEAVNEARAVLIALGEEVLV